MKNSLSGFLLFLLAIVLISCSNSEDNDMSAVSAKISWTQDVQDINMVAFGLKTSEISQNSTFNLVAGKGEIKWVSSGVEYSKRIDVGDSSIDDIECEQEGEHEGENIGCLFSLSFSGDVLTISNN